MIGNTNEGLVKLAQYLAGISTHESIWTEITRALAQLLGIELAAVGEYGPDGSVTLSHWSEPAAADVEASASASLKEAVIEVLDSGFFAMRRLPPGADSGRLPWELLFLPMTRGNQTHAALLIGEQRLSPFSKQELDFYLAIAGLAAVTAERLVGEHELRQHRAHLEDLVALRSSELLDSNHRLRLEVAQRLGAEAALRAEKDNLLRILESMDDFVAILDADYGVRYMNPALAKAVGDCAETRCYQLLNGADAPCEDCHLPSALAGETLRGEWTCARNGRVYDRVLTTLENADGSRSALAIMRDITERKRSENAIRQMAYYDHLTRLPNRTLFQDRLTVELARAMRHNTRMALMVLDLDHFKAVNDSLGHHAGDQLLRSASQRMHRLLRSQDTVARVGGDEFILICPDLNSARDAASVAAKLVNALAEPFALDGNSVLISASIGIALFPDHGQQGKALIEQADRAMYRAKELGRSGYQLAGEPLSERG